MTFVSVSGRARDDLRAALDAAGEYTDAAAIRLADAFDAAVGRLVAFPESGSPRNDLGRGVRLVVLRRFALNLFYHLHRGDEATQILVLRVLRQERDVDSETLT